MRYAARMPDRRVRGLTWLTSAAIATLTACGSHSSTAPTSTATPTANNNLVPGTYLSNLVDVMQLHSVHRLEIDWVSFRSQVLAATPGAKTILDTYPAIKVALGLLGDHHSFYQNAEGTGGVGNPSFPAGCAITAVDSPAVPADVGYVRVPSCCTASQSDLAADLQKLIRSGDADNLAGWIIDLRGNGGGNMWPMLAGVGPVLGVGTAGAFREPAGQTQWGYDSRGATLGGSVAAAVTNAYTVKRADPRVAVLTDKGVASSGEAIAVAFRGRPNTRAFGTETCGVPSANSAYNLADGATLYLTDALDVDRTGVAYSAPLPPDEVITDPSALLKRAIDWLRTGR